MSVARMLEQLLTEEEVRELWARLAGRGEASGWREGLGLRAYGVGFRV